MSDLQIALLGLGALVIGAVALYNKLQERAAARGAERSFRSRHADVLLEQTEVRREPTLDAPDRPTARAPSVAIEALPDPRLDDVVELELPQALPGAVLLEHWAASGERFGQRVLLAGTLDGAAWMRLTPRDPGTYRRTRAGLQLVTRQGPVAQAELAEFRASVEKLAVQLGAALSCQEMAAALQAARELDQLCAQADIQVVIHIAAAAAQTLRGSKIRSAAEAAGLVLEDDGRFALRDAEGRTLYTLSARDGGAFSAQTLKNAELPGISLAMDVPRAPDTQRTYDSMVQFALHLASFLGGVMVDDHGKALDERALAAIGAQLHAVRDILEAKGIAPGSAAALRLFA